MTKQGYKQTELGLIPKDWEVKTLMQIGKFSKGNGIRKDETNTGLIPAVRYGEIYTKHNDYIKEFYSFISPEITKQSKKLKKGDLLFSGSGETKEDIGKCVAFISTIEAYAGGDIVILSPKKVNSLYLGFLLNIPLIVKQKASKGQGDAVVHITAKQLSDIKIPLPPTIEEQTAIANALSDVDNLIDSLEKLIKKKKLIKQGALQKLLKPKEGWSEYTLGDICIIFKGSNLSKSKLSNGGRFKCILYGELFTHYNEAINNVDSFTNYDEGISSKTGDILFPGSTTTKGVDLAKACTLLLDNIRLGGDIIILRKKNFDYNSIFLTYYLNQEKKLEIGNLAKGITIYHLYGSDLKGIKVYFPSLDEQEEIADILSDMDKEIEHLQTKLNKYKQVKLGMMQKLLTGKIRLVQQVESIKPVEQSKSTPFDEATLIATFVNRYATKQNPITRFRYTKLLYLFHRYVDNNIDGFLKKAAGPYNPSNRYKGPEGILIKNKYAKIYGDKFYPDTNINEVEKYYKKKHSLDALVWLDEFSKYQDEHLELLATVDMAIIDLRNEAKEINVQNVKDVIARNPEWRPKLQRTIFSDNNIQRAINKSLKLFG